MPTTEMGVDAMDAVEATVPAGQPILMVNLLRYNDQAAYQAGTDAVPCSGREAYFTRYVPAFGKLTEGTGIKPFWVGAVQGAIVAPSDEWWDDVAIVEYPSFGAFRQVVESDAYKAEADPHRCAALADWRLIATVKTDLPE